MAANNALTLAVLEGTFAIHRLPPTAEIPLEILGHRMFSAMRTPQELSLLVPEDVPIVADKTEPGWRGLMIEGTLDFGLTGVLAAIAQVLAEAQISIFALSTYDTDYIFVKADRLEAACEALRQAGYGLRVGATLG
ncbi:MAG: ACT domain-containing protein [Leptolyngbya sp.]|nr:ACT domain-containing protein [Leptolyngbya sp.]